MPLGGVNTVIVMNANPKLLAMCLMALMIFSAAVVLDSGEEVAADPEPIPGAHDDHDDFTEWTSTNTLPTTAGSYYLANNVAVTSSSWTLDGNVTLCLNGHDVTASDTLNVSGNGTLILCECNTDIRY